MRDVEWDEEELESMGNGIDGARERGFFGHRGRERAASERTLYNRQP